MIDPRNTNSTHPDHALTGSPKHALDLRRNVEGRSPRRQMGSPAKDGLAFNLREFLEGRATLDETTDEVVTLREILASDPRSATCFPPLVAVSVLLLGKDLPARRFEFEEACEHLEMCRRVVSAGLTSAAGRTRRDLQGELAVILAVQAVRACSDRDLRAAFVSSKDALAEAWQSGDPELQYVLIRLHSRIVTRRGEFAEAAAIRAFSSRLTHQPGRRPKVWLHPWLWGLARQPLDKLNEQEIAA